MRLICFKSGKKNSADRLKNHIQSKKLHIKEVSNTLHWSSTKQVSPPTPTTLQLKTGDIEQDAILDGEDIKPSINTNLIRITAEQKEGAHSIKTDSMVNRTPMYQRMDSQELINEYNSIINSKELSSIEKKEKATCIFQWHIKRQHITHSPIEKLREREREHLQAIKQLDIQAGYQEKSSTKNISSGSSNSGQTPLSNLQRSQLYMGCDWNRELPF